MKIQLNRAYTNLEWFVISFVFLFPVTFLTVRHGVHVSLFALVFIAAYHYWSDKPPQIRINYPRDVLILLTFAGLFVSVLLSQIARGSLHLAAFDGPSRVFIAGIVFLLLKRLNIPYIRILGVAIPIALICIFAIIISRPLDPHWMGRYSMYFVDPNTLGSQSFILGLLSFLMIRWGKENLLPIITLQVLGGLLGLYVSVGSGSRGAWLTAPFILLLILFLRFGDIARASQSLKQKMWLQTIAVCISIFVIFFMGFYFSEKLSTRIISGYFEILSWFSGTNLDTSAGTRLSMWKFSFQFASESLFFGYGEEKNMMQILQNSPLNIAANETAINTMALTGPHSDILSKLLSAGLLGLVAYLCLLLVPFSIFWKYRNVQNFNVKQAARIGLYYIMGVLIAGLSNEQLSLKYLCTFYGLMIATLLAQVLYESSNAQRLTDSSVA